MEWICKRWSGFVKGGFVKHGFVKGGFVKHGFVKGGFVKGGFVKRRFVKGGFVKHDNLKLRWLTTVFPRLKDVRANCFCASLLRTQIHMPRHATSCIERARLVLK